MVNFGVINRVYTKFDLGDKHSLSLSLSLHSISNCISILYTIIVLLRNTGKRVSKVYYFIKPINNRYILLITQYIYQYIVPYLRINKFILKIS